MNEEDTPSCSSSLSSSDDDFLEFLLDDEDDKETEDDIALFSMLLSVTGESQSRPRSRNSFYVRERLEWERHVAKLLDEGPNAFSRLYRVDFESFVKLCAMIHPVIRDLLQKRGSTQWGPGKQITTEIGLHCLLRWLAGGTYLDIRLSAGISIPSFYRIAHLYMDAILLCEELAFSFPSTDAEISAASMAFESSAMV